MKDILLHPRFFDILILVLFSCAALRWAIAGDMGRTVYWASALSLNIAVVFMIGGAK